MKTGAIRTREIQQNHNRGGKFKPEGLKSTSSNTLPSLVTVSEIQKHVNQGGALKPQPSVDTFALAPKQKPLNIDEAGKEVQKAAKGLSKKAKIIVGIVMAAIVAAGAVFAVNKSKENQEYRD